MTYPRKLIGFEEILNNTADYKAEMGAEGIDAVIDETEQMLREKLRKLENLPEKVKPEDEPADLAGIEAMYRPFKKRKPLSDEAYRKHLKGALYGRYAGCALGAPVEFATSELMERFSQILGTEFPPTDYWKEAPQQWIPRYAVGFAKEFTQGNINFLSPDDDIIYTLLALLTMEKYGVDFRPENVAELWREYIPLNCTFTAERQVLENLQEGMKFPEAATFANPYVNWIGGFIRCDAYGYVNPLNPHKAASMAYNDIVLTHRNSGLYSAMYFAAVISLSFSGEPLKNIFREALCVVPPKSNFYRIVEWALDTAEEVTDYKTAVAKMTARFPGMSGVHSENNATLVIFGSLLGENDFTRGIGETVAMGFDNDCTGATVGSILGARLGIDQIPEHWYIYWNDKVKTYIKDHLWMDLNDVVDRFVAIGKRDASKESV